jgi:hypothetical protein
MTQKFYKDVNLLIACANLYENWYTFNFEYLVEFFISKINLKNLFFIGKDRQGINIIDIPRLNDDRFSNQLDIIIINFSDMLVYEDLNLEIALLKKLEKKIKIVFLISDPWRFDKKIMHYMENLKDCIWTVHSDFYAKKYSYKFPNLVIKTIPYFVGEKYKNMRLKRIYDIAFIGRCELKKKNIKLGRLKNLRVFYEESLSKLRSRFFKKKLVNKIFDTVVNLNMSYFSFNSYPLIKGENQLYHTPFRFVESGACGTLSIAPFLTDELINFYYPKHLIFNCNDSYSGIKQIINETKNEDFFKLSDKISLLTAKNHMAKNRCEFILSLCNDKIDSEARDFYECTF